MSELVSRYGDFPLGGTDASVVALAERLGTELIITLDRRHFGAVRSIGGASFTLLPEERGRVRQGSAGQAGGWSCGCQSIAVRTCAAIASASFACPSAGRSGGRMASGSGRTGPRRRMRSWWPRWRQPRRPGSKEAPADQPRAPCSGGHAAATGGDGPTGADRGWIAGCSATSTQGRVLAARGLPLMSASGRRRGGGTRHGPGHAAPPAGHAARGTARGTRHGLRGTRHAAPTGRTSHPHDVAVPIRAARHWRRDAVGAQDAHRG